MCDAEIVGLDPLRCCEVERLTLDDLGESGNGHQSVVDAAQQYVVGGR